jgi:hypothetical protein
MNKIEILKLFPHSFIIGNENNLKYKSHFDRIILPALDVLNSKTILINYERHSVFSAIITPQYWKLTNTVIGKEWSNLLLKDISLVEIKILLNFNDEEKIQQLMFKTEQDATMVKLLS